MFEMPDPLFVSRECFLKAEIAPFEIRDNGLELGERLLEIAIEFCRGARCLDTLDLLLFRHNRVLHRALQSRSQSVTRLTDSPSIKRVTSRWPGWTWVTLRTTLPLASS